MADTLYVSITVAILIVNVLALLVAGFLSIRAVVSRGSVRRASSLTPSYSHPGVFSKRQAATLYALGALSFVVLAISLFLRNGLLSNIAVGVSILVIVGACVLAFRKVKPEDRDGLK